MDKTDKGTVHKMNGLMTGHAFNIWQEFDAQDDAV